MKFAGIDYSITSPAICIYDEERNHYTFLSYSGASNVSGDVELDWNNFSIRIYKQRNKDDFKNNFERYNHIAEKMMIEFIKFEKNINSDCIAIEDYALGAKGRISDIVEATTLFKFRLFEKKYDLKQYPPKTLKKQIGGNGNLGKDDIYDQCWGSEEMKELMEYLKKHFKEKKSGMVQGDLLDAYAVMKMRMKEYHNE